MKQLKRTGVYKASNVEFNPITISAYSYDHWKFVSVINGLVVFNGYRYSSTTARHQAKVMHLMVSLGIKIDLHIETRYSLATSYALDDAYDVVSKQVQELEDKIINPRSKKALASERIAALQVLLETRSKIYALQGRKAA